MTDRLEQFFCCCALIRHNRRDVQGRGGDVRHTRAAKDQWTFPDLGQRVPPLDCVMVVSRQFAQKNKMMGYIIFLSLHF